MTFDVEEEEAGWREREKAAVLLLHSFPGNPPLFLLPPHHLGPMGSQREAYQGGFINDRATLTGCSIDRLPLLACLHIKLCVFRLVLQTSQLASC